MYSLKQPQQICWLIGSCKITLHGNPELVDEVLLPCSLDCRAQIGDDINEMREQLRKQVARLTELRIKKVEEPGAYQIRV
jgi:elongator complex protein 1